jgi:hypothetical protein
MPDLRPTAVLAVALSLVVVGEAGGVTASTAANEFVSHRAFYEMRLGRTTSQSKIIGADGRMAFEWREQCDGWVVQQQYLLEFADAEGNVRDLNSRYSNYESKDGKRYEFLVKKSGLATSEDEIKGSAARASSAGIDGPAVATFERPEELRHDLGDGTMFPSAHTFALLDIAASGGKFFSARIFDGSEVERESVVTAAIGSEKMGAGTGFAAADGRYWPIRLAFIEPTYEMNVDLLLNGIARTLTLDYGEYEIVLSLVDLEVFDRPRC